MDLKTIRVRKKALTCRTCETEFFGYSELPGAGKLYECNECDAIFTLPENVSMQDAAEGKDCPDCSAPLEDSLQEKTQAGICPMCENRDYYGTGEPEEVELEAYSL